MNDVRRKVFAALAALSVLTLLAWVPEHAGAETMSAGTYTWQLPAPALLPNPRLLAKFAPQVMPIISNPLTYDPDYRQQSACNAATFTVPAGIDYLEIVGAGTVGAYQPLGVNKSPIGPAALGSNYSGGPGRGAVVDGAIHVTPGERLYITVGQRAGNEYGGFPGGAYGDFGGGGATIVSTAAQTLMADPETSQSDRLQVRWCDVPRNALILVAGAGGGSGASVFGGGGGGGGNAGILDPLNGVPQEAESGRSGSGPKSGGGGGPGTASQGGGAGSHPGCGSEPRRDGGYLFGGFSRGDSAGGGAGYFGGGAGGGGDCFMNTGNGGGGGGSSYFNLSRSVAVPASQLGDSDYAHGGFGSVQIFGAPAASIAPVTNVIRLLAPMLGRWSCNGNQIHVAGSSGGRVQIVSYDEGPSYVIEWSPTLGAFLLHGGYGVDSPVIGTSLDLSPTLVQFPIPAWRRVMSLRLADGQLSVKRPTSPTDLTTTTCSPMPR